MGAKIPSKWRTTSPIVILAGLFAEHITAADSSGAVHPALRLEIQHNLLQKAFGNIIAPRKFTNRNRRAAEVIHQREQGAQSIICFL